MAIGADESFAESTLLNDSLRKVAPNANSDEPKYGGGANLFIKLSNIRCYK